MNATVKKKAAPKKRAQKKSSMQVVRAGDIDPDFEIEVPIETSLIPYDDRQQIAPIEQQSPIQQMQSMKEMGVSVDDMKEMLVLQREYEAGEAKKSFNLALAAFKSEDIQIFKRKTVSYTTDKGTTEYQHATLDDIVATTTPFLSKHGFSTRWRTEQSDKGMTRVIFILTHKDGHSEETGLQAGLDQSGGKNNIQALASTVSYLERYTFLAGTGLAVKDMDDDGAGAEPELIDVISETQLADIRALIEEVGSTEEQFVAHCKLQRLEDMPLNKYKSGVDILNARKRD